MRHSLVPVGVLVATLIAFLALTQVDSTRAECEGNTCDVVLDGLGASEHIFDQEVSLWGADGNVGLILHRGVVLGCKEGEVVQSGSLEWRCEAVGSDIVRAEFTRSSGERES